MPSTRDKFLDLTLLASQSLIVASMFLSSDMRENPIPFNQNFVSSALERLGLLEPMHVCKNIFQKAIDRLLLQPYHSPDRNLSILLTEMCTAWNLTLLVNMTCPHYRCFMIMHHILKFTDSSSGRCKPQYTITMARKTTGLCREKEIVVVVMILTNKTSPHFKSSSLINVYGYSLVSMDDMKDSFLKSILPPFMCLRNRVYTHSTKLTFGLIVVICLFHQAHAMTYVFMLIVFIIGGLPVIKHTLH